MTKEKNPHQLFAGYLSAFGKALDASVLKRTDLTLNEKISCIEALQEILTLHLENPEDAVDYKLIANILREKVIKPLRNKALPFHNEKLWVYFEPLSDRYFHYLATVSDRTAFTHDDYLTEEQHRHFLDCAFNLLSVEETHLYLSAPYPGNADEPGDEKAGNKEFTLRRQVLVMYYLDKGLNISNGADRTSYAQLIELLTGKNYKNIYDYIRSPFPDKISPRLVDDLKYIREYFVKLRLEQIIILIDKDIQLHK